MTEPEPDQIAEPQHEPAPGKPWYHKRAALAAAAILALAVTVGALFGAGVFSSSSPITARGTEMVFASPFNAQKVHAAYPDITDGAQVTVVNSAGTVIGTASLRSDPAATARALQAAGAESGTSGLSDSDFTEFVAESDFTVTVPGGLPRYGIRVGQNRGTIWVSAQEMQKDPRCRSARSVGDMVTSRWRAGGRVWASARAPQSWWSSCNGADCPRSTGSASCSRGHSYV